MDLETITKTVEPTSFPKVKEPDAINYDDVINDLLTSLNIDGELKYNFCEGAISEKYKRNNFTKIILETLLLILESDDPKIENKNEMIVHRNNKKIIKDLLIAVIGNIKNLSVDDKKVKVVLAGKVLQSLYDDKT